MQCFCCQSFGHKADFVTSEIVVSNARGTMNPALVQKMQRCLLDVRITQGTFRQLPGVPKNKEIQREEGLTRVSQPEAQMKPIDALGDFKEIISLFTSGTVRSYVNIFNTLIGNFRKQLDTI